jgi:hypothetical protein
MKLSCEQLCSVHCEAHLLVRPNCCLLDRRINPVEQPDHHVDDLVIRVRDM